MDQCRYSIGVQMLIKFLFVSFALSSFAFAGDTCVASKKYENKPAYSGCTTVVDGHENRSMGSDITEEGCKSFCSAAMESPSSVQVCVANFIFTKKKVYTGCEAVFNGHKSFSNPQELTELGCDSFCDPHPFLVNARVPDSLQPRELTPADGRSLPGDHDYGRRERRQQGRQNQQ